MNQRRRGCAGQDQRRKWTCEETAPEGAGEGQAPESAGEKQALEGAGKEQALEGAGEEQALEVADEEQALEGARVARNKCITVVNDKKTKTNGK